MVAQLFHATITFCLATGKKETNASISLGGKEKSKRNQTEQTQANSATRSSRLLKLNMEEILKAEPQAANFCICFLFLLKILSITSQQISTLLAVSPHHRHHLVSSQQTWTCFLLHCFGKSCGSTGKGKFPAQESLELWASRKASAERGYSELFAPSNIFRAAGQSCGPSNWSALWSRLQLVPSTQRLAFVKQGFKKHHSLGGKNPPEAWNYFPAAPAFPASFPRHTPARLAILPPCTTK